LFARGGGKVLRLGEPERARLSGRGAREQDSARRDPLPGTARAWPVEIRDWLDRATREANELRGERRRLIARVSELERDLEQANAKRRALEDQVTDLRQRLRDQRAPDAGPDRWLADVTDRTAQTLRSGQEVAQGIVERAGRRAQAIERAARKEAAEIRSRAEAEAQNILMVTQYDAEGLLQAARASGEELLAEAKGLQQRALAELANRRKAIEQDIHRLEAGRLELVETYGAIRSSVDAALSTLTGEIEPRPMRTIQDRLIDWWRRDREPPEPDPNVSHDSGR
jgi:cell division septum initiation protein DivIVA